jgi:DNA-binding GntR family transcriptional regulator
MNVPESERAMVGARPTRPPTLSEAALRRLREDLIRGRYRPGDRIRVDHVAAELGISALPVREALRVLLAEGRLEYEAHRGYRVSELTADDVEDIYLMCRLLEAEALRRGVPALDDAGIERMERALQALEAPPESASVWEMVSIHQEFHFVPVEYGRRPRIEAELRRLWDHTDHYRPLYLFAGLDVVDMMNQDHRALLAACAARDAERAIALLNEHREHALAQLFSERSAPNDKEEHSR